MEVCASLSLPDSQPQVTAVQVRLAAMSDVLQRIPYFFIYLHQPTKGQKTKTQVSLKKIKNPSRSRNSTSRHRLMAEWGERRGKKRKRRPLLSPPPCPAAPGRCPHSAVTCHSAAANCVGLKPVIPSLFSTVVALRLRGSDPGWAISEEMLGPLPCSSLCTALDRPHKT